MAGGVNLRLAAILLSATGLASPASGQEPTPVFEAFTEELVQTSIVGLGYSFEPFTLENGNPAWSVTTPDDFRFNLHSRVCDAGKCQGLSFYAYFDGAEISSDDLARYHAGFVYGRAYITRGDTLAVQNYLIADGGVTEANLRANIQVFVDLSARVPQHIRDLREKAADASN